MNEPIGIAHAPDPAAQEDTLRRRLDEARRQGGRGTVTTHRRLWRYCAQAFRDWHGIRLVEDEPVIRSTPLTHLEMAQLIALAQEVPGVIRDLLALQADAHRTRRQVVLSKLVWSPERQQMLIELHQLALFAAGVELGRAQLKLEEVYRDTRRGNQAESVKQRQRMVTCYQGEIARLEEQFAALTAKPVKS